MTREIKYRAFYEKMYQVDSWNMKDGIVSCSDSEGNVIVEKIKNLELMQSTGLFDKNGKTIYEGDILRQEREDNCFGGPNKTNVVTVGEPEYYVLSDMSSGGPDGNYPIVSQEIIGNIYEQPELINK